MNFSNENGCPLSVKSVLTRIYFVKSWNFGMVVSAVFLGIFKRKSYLLKVSQIRR